MRKFLIAAVRTYQIATTNLAPRCKYYPSCSQYTITAISRYGVKGLAMSIWRLVRCNPWSQGGVDYVDEHLDCADAQSSIAVKVDKNREKEVVGAN